MKEPKSGNDLLKDLEHMPKKRVIQKYLSKNQYILKLVRHFSIWFWSPIIENIKQTMYL